MSGYFADIATRSVQADSVSLTPSVVAVHQTTVPGTDSLFEDAGSNEWIQPEFSQTGFHQPSQPVVINEKDEITNSQQPLQPVGRNENTEPGRNNVLPYITAHTERLIIHEKISVDNQTFQTARGNNSDTVQDHPIVQIISKATHSENLFPQTGYERSDSDHNDILLSEDLKAVNNDDDKIKSGKIPVIAPPVKKELIDKNDKNLNWHIPVRIMPTQLSLHKDKPVNDNSNNNNNSNAPKPRLVIGKIIVEVLPSAKPVPPKIITRTVESPSTANHSKISRLSFGFGQL